ncbi:MAG: hypothetical protein FJ150_09190 [Euryarchaeota archaeon]|nr:hypothetical protein [Euryarchaeota archaeon]
MAVLTAAGIIFGGAGGVLESRYGIIPQGAAMVFLGGVPSGWSQSNTHSNKALRVVSSNGANSGGNQSFTSTFTNKSLSANVPITISGLGVGPFTLTVNTIPQHAHPANNGGGGSGGAASPNQGSSPGASAGGGATGNFGDQASHNHPVSFSSANGPGSATLDFTTRYVDVIICTFN